MRASPGLIEIAHLRGDVRLEEPVADNEKQEAQEKQIRHHEDEFGRRHQESTDDHRIALADPAIGDDAAKKGRQVYEACVESVDHGRERLDVERMSDQPFEGALYRMISDDVLGGSG